MSFITQGKTNWKFLVIVIILAIIVGGGALWYTKRPEKPYQQVEIKKSETADWKTYENEEYGFEIKYPLGSEANEDDYGVVIAYQNNRMRIRASSQLKLFHPEAQAEVSPEGFDVFLSEDFIINGVSFRRDYYTFYGGAGATGSGINIYTMQQHNGYYFTISESFNSIAGGIIRSRIPDELRDKDACEEGYWYKCAINPKSIKWLAEEVKTEEATVPEKIIFDQILSTFKFSEYYFKAVEDSDGVGVSKQFPDYFVEIYKNQELLKTIHIEDTNIEPSLFILSPDQKYVAFKTAHVGGTCVYEDFPVVIDLNTFSRVDLNDSDIGKKIGSAFNMDFNEMIKFSAVQKIDDIKWISNEAIRASMKFGDEKSWCAISFYNKPAGSPNEIKTDVDFTITKEAQQEELPKITCSDECSTGQKKCAGNGYQVCGNYDNDSCLEWGSITNCSADTICQNGSCVQQKCSDGTLYSQCSTNKPSYCENGNLINKCSICGCSSNQSCQSGESCKSKQTLEKVYSIIVGYMDDNSPEMHALWYYDLLTQYFNFDPTHVRLFTNKVSLVNDWVRDKGFNIFGGKNATNPIYGEPTKGNFLETLDWLKTNSTSEDKVVLLFFMHGGPYSDTLDNDIEADGDDEALIFKNSQLLVDGELAELLKGVKAKEMIIYTGSCYGGGFIWDLEKELGSLTNLRVIGGAHEDRIQWANTVEDWLFKYPYLDQWQDTAGRILWYVSGMYKDYENGTLNITPGLNIPIERAWLDFPNCTIPDLENLKSHMVYVTPGLNGEFNYSSMCGGTPPPENVTAYLNNNRDLFFFGLDEKQSIVDKSIKVLSPNGGEKLNKGSSYDITWNSTGLIKEVGISILKNHQNICSGGSCYGTIYTSNDGSYQWNVPGAFETGDNYTIKIEDMSERPIHDESDYYFSIINKQ